MRPLSVFWVGLVLLLAGCQDLEPAPCSSADRANHAALIQPLSDTARGQVMKDFEMQNRIARMELVQDKCHIHANVYVDSLATEAYAIAQTEALIRALKARAPGETKPLPDAPGEGLYDYLVTVHRDSASARSSQRRGEGQQPVLKGAKLYSENRVLWH